MIVSENNLSILFLLTEKVYIKTYGLDYLATLFKNRSEKQNPQEKLQNSNIEFCFFKFTENI